MSAITLWAESPSADISVRMLARNADAAVSAVDYHFGGLERLYVEAQSHALAEARAWTEARIAQLSTLEGCRLQAADRASVIASTIDDWTERKRPLAMAWREACSAARIGTDRSSHAEWSALWSHFWRRISAILGMPAQADVLAAFHDGEATQHLLRWKRGMDRALLDETVVALIDHLENKPRGPAPVRTAYQQLAEREYASALEQETRSSEGLDLAAAEILRDNGVSALTFRGVARQAGTTLGNASYHFGSKSRMLKRAFETLYRMGSGSHEELNQAGGDALFEAVLDATAGGNQSILRAFDEVILHISRCEDYTALRGLIRGYRDPAAGWVLGGLLDPAKSIPSSLAAVFSSVCRGMDHLTLSLGTADSKNVSRAILNEFLQR